VARGRRATGDQWIGAAGQPRPPAWVAPQVDVLSDHWLWFATDLRTPRNQERGLRATERVVGKVRRTGGRPVTPSATSFASRMSAKVKEGLSGMGLVMADSSCLTCKVADMDTIVIILDGYRTTLVVTSCTVFKGKKIDGIAAYQQAFYHSCKTSVAHFLLQPGSRDLGVITIALA
jgi:hypothetical protein